MDLPLTVVIKDGCSNTHVLIKIHMVNDRMVNKRGRVCVCQRELTLQKTEERTEVQKEKLVCVVCMCISRTVIQLNALVKTLMQ